MSLIVITPARGRHHGQYDDAEYNRFLPDGKGDVIQVCKNICMHIFPITNHRIENIHVSQNKMVI